MPSSRNVSNLMKTKSKLECIIQLTVEHFWACKIDRMIRACFECIIFIFNLFRCYMTAPALKLEILNCCNSEAPICIAAVPSHLYHITFELFKVEIDNFNLL